jgi:hypothetical protein
MRGGRRAVANGRSARRTDDMETAWQSVYATAVG